MRGRLGKKQHILALALLLILVPTVFAGITSSSPDEYSTFLEGKNEYLTIEHNYPAASIFWSINGEVIESNNNQKEFFINTTKFINDHPEINFDDSNIDTEISVNVIDSTNPFNSDNITWKLFIEPQNFSFTTDKTTYYTGKTILLELDVQKDTKLDIIIKNSAGATVLQYPTVTVEDIKEFIIDAPDNAGTYTIVTKSKFHEYQKTMTKSISVEENTYVELEENFNKISAFPENPTINETITFEALMYDDDNLKFQWDFDLDGTYDAEGKEVTHSFGEEDSYIVKVKITNTETGETITEHYTIEVGEENIIVNFIVKNFFTKNSIPNAKIVINNKEYTASSSGEVTITIPKGTYPVKVAHPDYNEYNQNIDIISNYIQTIYLYKADEFELAIKSDKSKPKITLIKPEEKSVTSELLTTFEFNASDDIYLDECTLYIKPKNAVDWTQKFTRTNLGETTHQEITVDLGFNTYLYKIICKDKKNNQVISDAREFSVSQYATQNMYQDDIDKLSDFIDTIDEAVTDPKGTDDLLQEIYEIYNVENNLVEIARQARKLKDDFTMLLMDKKSPTDINNKINEINQFEQEQLQHNIKRIKVLEAKQVVRASTKDKIQAIISNLYNGLFSEEIIEQLTSNIYQKQTNLDIITKLVKVEIKYLNNQTKEQVIVMNQFSQANLEDGSLIYQLIPEAITTSPRNIEIPNLLAEVTKTTDTNIIITIYPEQSNGKSVYFINGNADISKVDALNTILIDNADKTENIKKITDKTNDVESLSEEEKPNILNNIEKTTKTKTPLENIQGNAITELPTEYHAGPEDIIPFITLGVIIAIMLGTGVVMFGPKQQTKTENIDDELDLLQGEINEIQARITQKISTLIQDEDKFIGEVTENNKEEKELIEEVSEEVIEQEKLQEIIKQKENEIEQEEQVKIEEQKQKEETLNKIKQNIIKNKPEIHHKNTEFFVSGDDEETQNRIKDFSSQIESLRKDII